MKFYKFLDKQLKLKGETRKSVLKDFKRKISAYYLLMMSNSNRIPPVDIIKFLAEKLNVEYTILAKLALEDKLAQRRDFLERYYFGDKNAI